MPDADRERSIAERKMEHAGLDNVRTSKPNACPLRLTNELLASRDVRSVFGMRTDFRGSAVYSCSPDRRS
jgi:hypothetical protein